MGHEMGRPETGDGSVSVVYVDTDTGDDNIITGYSNYADQSRNTLLLFSNDYGFVENAREDGLHAHHVDIPVDLPRKTTASWWAIENTLYYLAVIFGVVVLPKVTIYGVWNGKTGTHWQNEQLDIVLRSPKIESIIERDLTILEGE